MTSPPPAPPPVPSRRRQLIGWLAGIGALLGIFALMGATLRETLTAAAASVTESLGPIGVFVGTYVSDTIPITSNEPFLFLGRQGGFSFWQIVAMAGSASILAGATCWSVGWLLKGRGGWVARFRQSPVGQLLERRGAIAVAAAALTPLPFGLTSWGAGATGMRLSLLMAVAFLRYPRMMVYLGVMDLGWSLTA